MLHYMDDLIWLGVSALIPLVVLVVYVAWTMLFGSSDTDVEGWRAFPQGESVQQWAELPAGDGPWEQVEAEVLDAGLNWCRGSFRRGEVEVEHHVLDARRRLHRYPRHREIAERCCPEDSLGEVREMYLSRALGHPSGSQFSLAGHDNLAVYAFRQAGSFYVLRGVSDELQRLAKAVSDETPTDEF
jgi:hypothetical protein